MNVFVTAKGAAMKTNSWSEGQEISCSNEVAALFIEKGIATESKSEAAPKTSEQQVKTDSKNKKSK